MKTLMSREKKGDAPLLLPSGPPYRPLPPPWDGALISASSPTGGPSVAPGTPGFSPGRGGRAGGPQQFAFPAGPQQLQGFLGLQSGLCCFVGSEQGARDELSDGPHDEGQ